MFGRLPDRVRYTVAALIPGLLLSTLIAGPLGTALAPARGSSVDVSGDFSMSLAAMSHALRAPWDSIFAPPTFDGGVHLTAADGYALLLPLVRLLGSVDAAMNVLIVLAPMIQALGLAWLARVLGLRGSLNGFAVGTVAVAWPPFLLAFFGYEAWPHIASAGLIAGASAMAISMSRNTDARLIPTGAALSLVAFLLFPYLGLVCGLALAGATIDLLVRRRDKRTMLLALGSAGGILISLWLMGYFDPGYDRTTDGYPGHVSQNLLGGILPVGCSPCSPLFSLEAPAGQDPTTYSFAGLGGALLSFVALLFAARLLFQASQRQRLRRYLGLITALSAGALYALGPELTVGPMVVGRLPFPIAEISEAVAVWLRDRWFFAWPVLFLLIAGGAAIIGRSRYASPVLLCLAITQLLWAQPLMARYDTYQKDLQTPWNAFFDELAPFSPGGFRFAEPMRCSRALLHDPYPEGFVPVHAATRAAGEAGIPVIGARTVRNPLDSGCGATTDELFASHRNGVTLLLTGGFEEIDPPPVLPGLYCYAVPLMVVCPPGDSRSIEDLPMAEIYGLPVDRLGGYPLIPASLSGPRLAAAVAVSGLGWRVGGVGWREKVKAIDQLDDMQMSLSAENGAWLRVAWRAVDGAVLHLVFRSPDDGSVVQLSVFGACDDRRCTVSERIAPRGAPLLLESMRIADR